MLDRSFALVVLRDLPGLFIRFIYSEYLTCYGSKTADIPFAVELFTVTTPLVDKERSCVEEIRCTYVLIPP